MKNFIKIIIFLTVSVLLARIVFIVATDNKLTNQKEQSQLSVHKNKSFLDNADLPLKQAKQRITKKFFGIKISPENSPISPERFSGYHTGTDYEIFSDEENLDVEVFAICSGRLLKKEMISGYGGALIQECKLENQLVTVLYGHINLNSVQQEVGENVKKEDLLALLGQAFSSDTDGERKHLHLGIHKGNEIDVRGYVSKKSDLNNWIDFEQY